MTPVRTPETLLAFHPTSRSKFDGRCLFLLFLLTVIFTFNVPAFADWQMGSSIIDRPNNYDYSPSMMVEGTVHKFWWCSSAPVPGNSSEIADTIFYTSFDFSTGQWSPKIQVLSLIPGSWEDGHGAGVCNPGVVKGTFSPGDGNTYSYAMYYVAQNDNMNKIGVAFSNNGISWSKYAGNPIIYPINFPSPAGTYGAGEPAPLNATGRSGIYLLYYDDSSPAGPRSFWRWAEDGIHFGPPTQISIAGAPNAVATDFGYDYQAGAFYSVWANLPCRPGDRECFSFNTYRMTADDFWSGQGSWQPLGVVDTNLTGSYLNLQPRLGKDIYGNVTPFLPDIPIYYAQGTNNTGDWNINWIIRHPEPSTLPLVRYNNGYDHWTSTGYVSPGYYQEGPQGYLLMAPAPNTIPLYGCVAEGNDHFVALDENECASPHIELGINGWLYTSPPAGVDTVPLYRCYAGDHFVSTDASCEGQQFWSFLGYALANPQ